MSTHDVPGANKANHDVLTAGCWAEHEDGSLLFVKGTEQGQVVYELYDLAQDPPVYYQDAMTDTTFKDQFSFRAGISDIDWVWHDKSPFPWSRVMRTFERPAPLHADVQDMLSAAARVAESLKLRAQGLDQNAVSGRTERSTSKQRSILERLERAFEAFAE